MSTLSILMYHRIVPTAAERSAMAVSLPDFVAQMALLARERVAVLPLEAVLLLQGAGIVPSRPTVALTFDDGYAATCDRVEAVFARTGYVGTLYLTTGLVGQRDPLDGTGEGALTWAAIRQMRQLRIAAHTVSHPRLALLPLAAVRRELRESKAHLEHELGRPVTQFAYPFGSYTALVRDEVRAAGYTSAGTVRRGPLRGGDDPWRLRRITIDGRDSPAIFVQKVLTGYGSSYEQCVSGVRDTVVRLPGIHDLTERYFRGRV